MIERGHETSNTTTEPLPSPILAAGTLLPIGALLATNAPRLTWRVLEERMRLEVVSAEEQDDSARINGPLCMRKLLVRHSEPIESYRYGI